MKGTTATWLVTVPPNTTAQLPLPAAQQDKFTLDGESLASNNNSGHWGNAEGSTTYELPLALIRFGLLPKVQRMRRAVKYPITWEAAHF